MPRKPWKVRGTAGLSEKLYCYFTSGPFFSAEDFADGKTEDDLRALWREHRDAILRRYLAELAARGPAFAGTRPDRYWRDLEAAGHVRRQIGTHEWWGPWEPGGQKRRETPVYESDLEHLARVRPGDLAPWELETHRAAVTARGTD